VRRADLILALEAGRIAEIGTHDDLVAREGGVYAKLYALQAFESGEGGANGAPVRHEVTT
jgi:ABC-type transport system involved in cytochrome bd biosynthesis fused ATPase/permease subunit